MQSRTRIFLYSMRVLVFLQIIYLSVYCFHTARERTRLISPLDEMTLGALIGFTMLPTSVLDGYKDVAC